MPLISQTETGFSRHLPETRDEIKEDGPGFLDVVQASFENENTLINWAANGFSFGQDFLPQEGYNPFNDIEGYELYSDSFIDVKSPEHAQAVKMQIDNETRNMELIGNSGFTGVLSQIAAGATDPVYWPLMLTGTGQARLAMTTGQAFRRAAVIGGASEIPAEAIKQQLQETRTIQESAFNIGGAAVLSGLLGAGLNKLAGNPKYAPEIKRLEKELEVWANSDEPGPLSVGAAQNVMSKEDLELVGAGGLEKLPVSPLVRTQTSPSVEVNRVAAQMMETPLVSKGNIEGKSTTPEGGTVETRIKRWDFNLYEGLVSTKDNFKKYKKSAQGKFLSYADFRKEIGKAMRRGDKHEIPEVAQAAKDIRSKGLDPLKEAAIKEKLLPENVDVSTAESYLMRVYRHDQITARRPEWNKVVDDWLKGIRESARLKLSQAGDKATPSLKGEAGITDDEIAVIRNEITDNIMGVSNGRTSYDVVQLERGPLKERVFNIPDSKIEEFLESDIDVVLRQYVRTMAPDVELNRMFGTVTMKDQIDEINDAYVKLINEAKTEKQRETLKKRQENDVRDLAAMRDRLRGTYMTPKDPNSFFLKAGRTIRDFNFMRLLGGMTISAIPDVARLAAVNGLKPVGKSFAQLVSSPKRFGLARAEAKKAAVGMEMVLNSRASSLAEIADASQRGSAFERGMRGVTDTFSKMTLMSQWNDALKQFSGVTTSDRILTESLNWANGKISKSAMKRLAASGIDEGLAKRIASQFAKHGDDGIIKLPGGDKWDDSGALETFRSAVLKDVDRTIITPGAGEKPLWTSSETGKMVFQFKTFAAVAHHKALVSGLQYRDAAELNGFLLATALGGVVYGLKNYVAGREVSTDPEVVIQEALDRSGVFGYFWDVNNMSAKFTNGEISVERFLGDQPMSRYASRNIWGALLGPTVDAVEDMREVTGNVATGEFSEKDINRIRKMLPGQNLFYMRQLLDSLQEEL